MSGPSSLALIAPALVWPTATGATAGVSFDCTILKSRDMSGACSGKGDSVTFEFIPMRVGNDGEGTCAPVTGNYLTEAYFFSRTGPVIRAIGDENVQTVALGSARNIVWTAPGFDDPAKSRTHFLKCEAP